MEVCRGGKRVRGAERGEEGANCCSESRSGTEARRTKCPGLCRGAARVGPWQKIIKFKFHLLLAASSSSPASRITIPGVGGDQMRKSEHLRG